MFDSFYKLNGQLTVTVSKLLMTFLSERPMTSRATFAEAFDAVRSRDDFATIAAKQVGKYEVFVGEGAKRATDTGTTVSPEAKAYVQNWLQEAYGVTLK